MRTQRRDDDRPQLEFRDYARERPAGLVIVLLTHDQLLRDCLHEERPLQVEGATLCRQEVASSRNDFALLLQHAQDGRACRVTLADRDVAQCSQHLRHVSDFRESPRDVLHRAALVLVDMRFEYEAVASAPCHALDVAGREVRPRRAKVQREVSWLPIAERRPQFPLDRCGVAVEECRDGHSIANGRAQPTLPARVRIYDAKIASEYEYTGVKRIEQM